jgi:hypothetical protein
MSIHRQEQLGSILTGLGLIYGVHLGTLNFSALQQGALPVVPLEICGMGALVWLHAKWRRTTSINR